MIQEICSNNRFELIQKYKEKLIQGTNIETAKEEMNVIDNILFRFWQMGWLDILEKQMPKKLTIDEYDDETYSYIYSCGAKIEEKSTILRGSREALKDRSGE